MFYYSACVTCWVNLQVEKEIKKREERDHELLHLYVEATKDAGECIILNGHTVSEYSNGKVSILLAALRVFPLIVIQARCT